MAFLVDELGGVEEVSEDQPVQKRLAYQGLLFTLGGIGTADKVVIVDQCCGFS